MLIAMKGFNRWREIVLLMLYVVLQLCKGAPTNGEKLKRAMREIQTTVIDMGVDYNDEPVLDHLKKALAKVITDDLTVNTYAESRGDPKLLRSIAQFYSRVIERQLDWKNEVITTVGATEAMATTIRALSKPGDEWILIQPFFNFFKTAIELAYVVPRYANLKPKILRSKLSANEWELDRDEMKSLINPKTKGIVFNNPNNPLGKVYTREEMDFIAQLAKDNDLLVISDEVHEFTTDSMIKMVSLPDMFERTLTIGSASKAFLIPGWRVGWIIGPKLFIDEINKVHYHTINFIPPALQRAVATIFEDEFKNFGNPASFLAQNLDSIKRKRNFFVRALQDAHVLPIIPSGGYCMLAGWWEISDTQDRRFNIKSPLSKNLVSDLLRLTNINAFDAIKYYGDGQGYKPISALRFCYHKSNGTLENAAIHLLKLGAPKIK